METIRFMLFILLGVMVGVLSGLSLSSCSTDNYKQDQTPTLRLRGTGDVVSGKEKIATRLFFSVSNPHVTVKKAFVTCYEADRPVMTQTQSLTLPPRQDTDFNMVFMTPNHSVDGKVSYLCDLKVQ